MIDFGWVLPYGETRMPQDSVEFMPHARRIIARLRGHFHSLWMPDHFMFGQTDVPEALTTLSFVAGEFPAFAVGTLVLSQSYRNPALLAKMAATLQTLSDGRFILGIGAGWREEEYRAYDYEFPALPARIAQMAEVIQICRAMWDPAQPEPTFHGEHYRIEGAVCLPKPVPAPPVMIGGGGEKLTLRIVAELADWWNLVGVTPAVYAQKLDVLAQHCAAADRDPATIRKTWAGVISIAHTRGQAEAQMAGYPIWPGDTPVLGTPDEVAAQLGAFVELGVDLFQLSFVDEPEAQGVDLFASDVIPHFRRS